MSLSSKRVNRTDKFCSSVKKKDVTCVLSNIDPIQCECAHIVPLNGEYGQLNYENPETLNNPANGMLLSKELHYLFDSFIWSIEPTNYKVLEGIPIKYKYNIVIASDYKDKNISINRYKTIILRAECHHFIELAHTIFLDTWNSIENENILKLNIKKKSKIADITKKKSKIKKGLELYNNGLTTIEKLETEKRAQLTDLLEGIIINNNTKYFSKEYKMELSEKYNLHITSITTYYNKLKKQYNFKK